MLGTALVSGQRPFKLYWPGGKSEVIYALPSTGMALVPIRCASLGTCGQSVSAATLPPSEKGV